MALNRTVDLLPEIFRTDTNKKFLAATLDQLTQEPNVKRTQGYVGRRVGPGVNPADKYIIEPTSTRTNYQLEPSIVFLDPNTSTVQDSMTYPGMIDALKLQDGNTNRQDRLFESEYYSWDPFCDLDKFNNYSQYYWLASGPDSVDVSTTEVPLTDNIAVTRNATNYEFFGTPGKNPIITLVRGGNYTFDVNQLGHKFWIQSYPGIEGKNPITPNISTRNVLGVVNNGDDVGSVEFYVPLNTAQDFYYGLTELAPVDLVTNLKFTDLNNVYVSQFLTAYPDGIDGITNLDGRTLIFLNKDTNPESGGWQISTLYDPLLNTPGAQGQLGSFDSLLYDQTTDITLQSQLYSVWKIVYVYDGDDNPYIQLQSVLDVPNLSKFRIKYGAEYNSTSFYKDASGYYNQVPQLTAVLDTLYYQDSTNPEIFGEIRLIDQAQTQPIDINEIIGAKTYTSPNGVVFTNGLKVQFRGLTTPAQFENLEYYVEGVGTGLGIKNRVGFINGEAYFGEWHLVGTQRITGPANTTDFQFYIYPTVEESLLNYGAGGPVGAPLPTTSMPGAAIGNGIRLIPVSEMVTPETYTKSATIPYDSTTYDSTNYDASLNSPLVPDYITINRGSYDRNAWSRSNRWFHIDVINYSAQLNNSPAIINNELRAKRPIIEFRPDINLWNSGTEAKQPVNIIDFRQTDALSNVNGQVGYGINGYAFLNGTRVIFAADVDNQVRNKIYEVRFIDPNNTGNLVIDLVEVPGGQPHYNQSVICLSGNTFQGKTFWFNGVTWVEAQEKTNVNQPPLFDVYDPNGISFGNREVYPSSTFVGSRLFGYADGGTSIVDEVLGISLKFLNIDNVGDILFSNFLYNDTFIYVSNKQSITENISNGFVRQYIDRILFSSQLGWQTAAAENRSRQVFQFTYDGSPLVLDVPVDQASIYPPVQVFAEGIFVDPGRYSLTVTDTTTTITFSDPPALQLVVEVQAISNYASKVAFYQIPLNLENNSLNKNSTEFTLGTIRTYYNTIGQNLKDIVGPINGANNTRDLGDLIPYGTNIVQQSAPLVLPGVFLRDPQYDIFNSLTFNSQEYTKYKAKLLDLATNGDFVNLTPTQVLDSVIQEISLGRTEMFPFYWSDMLPAGETYTTLTYTYTNISTNVFEVGSIYDFTSSNFQSLLVYLNGTLLTRGYDYTVSTESSTITVTTTLAVGDVITIREYPTTYGSFVPNTPTKMGLYPAFKPEIFFDESFTTPSNVIRGHDGSITVAFNDFRDQVLLEFETRIFNNLKIATAVPLSEYDVIPGQFRTTDYTIEEINSILYPDFLGWVGWNKLDYTSQYYINYNQFTYNYSQSSNRLNGKPLLGAWRGIYNYFYDTISPNTTPWEMLGFSQEPDWWQTVYGPAPYTSGNLVLWRDLERGYIADPMNPRVDVRFARPGLTDVIPSGSEGALLSPLEAVVGNYDATSFRRSWAFGDGGPVENAWRTSSSWPFAVMRLLALTKPAKFFNLFVDRDLYVFDSGLDQYLWNKRYRIEAPNLAPLYGNGVSKASYINWIIDYNQQRGINSSDGLTNRLDNLDVRLCWRVAGFTDKHYLKISSERSTPGGSNIGLTLPDESYQLLLYQDQPFEQITYSSVIIQNTDDGWAVTGYNSLASYFEIKTSRPNGKSVIVSAGGSQERVSIEYSSDVRRVPYGFVFTSRAAVCDFLYSYGARLADLGMTFEGVENGYIMNWPQMAQEFLYWSNQGWITGSIINLNPAATSVSVTRPGAVVESIFPSRLDNIVLNQNRQAILPANLIIDRLGNTFKIASVGGNSINFLRLRFTAYEHIVILDNTSIFADLIYNPVTGARQSRMLVSGWISGDWNGQVNAPGFVLNQDNIKEWLPNKKYTKGDIVLFKDQYWSASTIIKPSATFDYNLWLKSDYGMIQKGLLPNAANASDQLAQAYSVYNANLEQEVDLFSYGLIGFRPREYMQQLNLDDVSQVNLYKEFLGIKGTKQATNLFSLANFGKEVAEYSVREYWAILRGMYGANANSSYFEVLLHQSELPSDPALIQVVEPEQQSDADQLVLLENIWKSSYKLTSTNILPTTTTAITDVGLPSAGYVSLDDVDITVFDLNDPTNINSVLSNVGVGTTIWVARVNTYDWNVYRAEKVPGTITRIENNLNDASLVTFNTAHGLTVGDTLIIKYFSDTINGVYKVKSVPSINTLIIDYQFIGPVTFRVGAGLGLTLQTTRVAQASDIPTLDYADQLLPGVKVWVDDNGYDRWTVLEKTDPYSTAPTLEPTIPVANSNFGESISQGLNNLVALIGAPAYTEDSSEESPPGAVYSFVRTAQDEYAQNSIIALNAVGTVGFGNAVDVGDQSWALMGASASNSGQGYAANMYVRPGNNVFDLKQLFLAPDLNFDGGLFGYAVSVSLDERWMYITAPDHNRVYAYGRVDVQSQSIEYRTLTTQDEYQWNNAINIDYTKPNQLSVVLDNALLTYGVDYTVTAQNIVLNQYPEMDNKVLIISRRNSIQLDQTIHDGVPASNNIGSGVGATFNVTTLRGTYETSIGDPGEGYAVNDLLTLDQDDIATTDVPPPAPVTTNYVSNLGATITVSSVTGIVPGMTVTGTGFYSGQYVESVTAPSTVTLNASPNSTPTGSLTFSHDAKIVVTAVNADGAIESFDITGAGVDNAEEFSVSNWLTTVGDIYSCAITVNNVLQRPWVDYELVDGELTFLTVPGEAAIIYVVGGSYFGHVATLEIDGLASDAQFGYSVTCNTNGSHVVIGCPANDNEQGTVYTFDRSMQRFIVTDTAQIDYYTVQSLTDPGYINVTLNGEFLVNTENNVNGTFTVNGSYVTILAPLAVGDVIQVETNQFELLETIVSNEPTDGAGFGASLDVCINSCSMYVGSPDYSSDLQQSGKVEMFRNQSRVYGTITSTVANPDLTAGDYIRINNCFIAVPASPNNTIAGLVNAINPSLYISTKQYYTGDRVVYNGLYYVAITSSLANPPTNTDYWAPSVYISNVQASSTPNIEYIGDGNTQTYDVGDIYSSASSYNTRVFVDDVLQTENVDYTYNATTKQILFTTAPFNTASVVIVSGRITISVINSEAAQPLNKLQVAPGTGTVFDDLGFEVYAWQQKIVSPVPQYKANFGQSVFISTDALTLVVGAPGGNMILPTTFDGGKTYFDSGSTNFADPILQSGAVYEYDHLSSASPTVSNPGQFVFGQQFTNTNAQTNGRFGRAVNYTTGVMLIGSPGNNNIDTDADQYGQVYQFHNATNSPSWQPVRVQTPSVDTALLNTMFMYDVATNAPKQYFDFFDPLQGKLLGVVRQNIDFIGAVDPALYNVGTLNNYGSKWAQSHVGQIWWDTSNARFIDPHQNDIVYASRRWGQLFPGSTVQMYQWIVSSVPPAEYTGPGTARDVNSYVISSSLNLQGFLETQYYFWVTGISTVDRVAKKTLSINTLTQYIENPRGSGISYIAPIDSSTLAIYNGLDYISADDTVLYIGYDRIANDDAVHVEYQLVAQDVADSFLTATLYRKFLDSLTGSDSAGAAVPDPFLSVSQRYGVEFRPRQSMVVNRFLALKNYIGQANSVLAQFPISETRRFNILNSAEPEPAQSSGEWNKRVADYEELLYQNLAEVPYGFKYLVMSDSTNRGFWTIYEVIAVDLVGSKSLRLVRVQNYDTRQYWSYVNWYRADYNPLSRILLEVPNVSSLDTLTVPIGSAVKVTRNAQNKWEIYLKEVSGWNRVALQQGTIELSNTLWDYSEGRFGFDSEVFDAQYYDQTPTIETRKIIEAINQELLIGDLLIERNRLLILMFNYILSEQEAPQWLTKTSLIDVSHVIRDLIPYPIYRRDNQDFVFNYIQEVKPYHVQIREFNLQYQGFDQYQGALVDFDVPAYYDSEAGMFISPVLDNTGTLSTTSSRPDTAAIWTTFPWNQWFQNYYLEIQSVTVIDGGSGYTTPPTVTVTGECLQQAEMTAVINSAGKVVAVEVINPGDGYLTTATITFTGGNGSGAVAVAVMGNNKVRNLTTVIRYDRYQYTPTLTEWTANTAYEAGALVRYNDRVWSANTSLQTTSFDPTEWTVVPAGDLSGVDRTMGYYVPTLNQPGLDLALLISGIDYPGVQVYGPGFDQNTGFDVGNYDINPYDNISFSPEGSPTYDPAILDAIYESSFTDPYLGTLPAPAYNGNPPNGGPNPIVVDGGAFVDTYESHAPEELVPGITYDTLDIRVNTTPGADWRGLGHGSPRASVTYTYDTMITAYSFGGLLTEFTPMVVEVFNVTQGLAISPTSYNWADYTVSITTGAVVGDIIYIQVIAPGGGNQLYSNTYLGTDTVDGVVIPFARDLIDSFLIFNGQNRLASSEYEVTEIDQSTTLVTFDNTYSSTDRINLLALGYAASGDTHSWSLPVTQSWVADGSQSLTLTNSLQGTNPVNVVVTRNGVRARPYEGARYISDGIEQTFELPTRGGYSQGLVADNDVSVYINNQAQILGINYTLDAWDGSSNRTITLTTSAAVGDKILVSVRTAAQYWIVGDQINFRASAGFTPQVGDLIEITTWNDTSEQDLLTQVFAGSNTQGIVISENYDETLFDEGSVNNDPGSFDYSEGIQVANNRFDIGRAIIDPDSLIVTLNGRFLFNDQGFTVDGTNVVITGPALNPSQIVVITSTTSSKVPAALSFRVFQDMRGLQSTYRITPETTTKLVEPLAADDDVIFVENASNLTLPDLPNGIFGLIAIDGEHIAYRYRDTDANTVSGLRRGIAGTAADSHPIDAEVFDIGRGNLLPVEYQNYIAEQNFLADGTTTEFVTDDISVLEVPESEQDQAVLVYVGGTLQTSGYTVSSVDPVAVTFTVAPLQGYQVSIRVQRGLSWYQPGAGTASDGVPLQETNTLAARFMRGG